MRGKDGKVQNITLQDGITPAYAGKSFLYRSTDTHR